MTYAIVQHEDLELKPPNHPNCRCVMVVPREAEVFLIKEDGNKVPLKADWTHSAKLEAVSRKPDPFDELGITINKMIVECDAIPKAKRIK